MSRTGRSRGAEGGHEESPRPREAYVSGAARSVAFARREDGSEPAREFYNNLSMGDQAKFANRFRSIAQTGSIPNSEKFRPNVGTIKCNCSGKVTEYPVAEFKIHSGPGYRIMACLDGREWVLTHGFKKKGAKVPTEVTKAGRIFCEDLSLRSTRR